MTVDGGRWSDKTSWIADRQSRKGGKERFQGLESLATFMDGKKLFDGKDLSKWQHNPADNLGGFETVKLTSVQDTLFMAQQRVIFALPVGASRSTRSLIDRIPKLTFLPLHSEYQKG